MTADVVKHCSSCFGLFPWTEEYFFRWKPSDRRLGCVCRACKNMAQRKSYAKLVADPEWRLRHNKKIRGWRAANPDKVLAQNAKNREKSREVANDPEHKRIMRIIYNLGYARRRAELEKDPVALAAFRKRNAEMKRRRYHKNKKEKENADQT